MIEDDLRTALLPAFGSTELVLAHENGRRPPGVYATMRIESSRKTHVIVGKLKPDGTRTFTAHGQGLLELQCFGQGSFDVLDTAVQLLAASEPQDAAVAGNVAFGPTNRVESVPALRNDSSWEPRAVVSLPFAYTREVSEALSWIETVEGTIGLDGWITPYTAAIVDNPNILE
jgi:hypothetical protein